MAWKSAIIKHIAVIKWPDKGPYAESHLMEGELLANNTLRWVGLGNYGNSFFTCTWKYVRVEMCGGEGGM